MENLDIISFKRQENSKQQENIKIMRPGCLKGKAIAVQAYYRTWGFLEVEVPRSQDSRHMKVVKVVRPTYRPPLPTSKNSWYSFVRQNYV